MAYCTLDDIKNQIEAERLVQLTDDSGTGEIDEAKVARAIADADEMIDTYLASRMSVPLSPVPPIVRACSVDLAIYNLYSRRDLLSEVRTRRYSDAVKFLQIVARGDATLGSRDPGGNPPETGAVDYSASDQVFTSDKLDRF